MAQTRCCHCAFLQSSKDFQTQLSRRNHFSFFPWDDGEKRKIDGVKEQQWRGRILLRPPALPPLQAPSLSEQLKSLRYIIGANQSRMRKALRWNSRNYLHPQLPSSTSSCCPRVPDSLCGFFFSFFWGGSELRTSKSRRWWNNSLIQWSHNEKKQKVTLGDD